MEIKLLGITVCSVRTHLYIQFSYQSTIKKNNCKKAKHLEKACNFCLFRATTMPKSPDDDGRYLPARRTGGSLKILLCKRKWFAYVNPRPEIDEVNFQMKLHTVVKI